MLPRNVRTAAVVALLLGPLAGLPISTNLQAQGRGGSATTIQPGQACPAGTTETRPQTCTAPQAEAPSILDYRPRSTLVAPEHLVPAAKYPVVDFHGHPRGNLGSVADIEKMGREMDTLNVRLMIAADNMSGESISRAMALINASPTMKNRVRVLAGINFSGVGPGWAEKAVKQLEADVAAGAVGIGEIPKSLGLSYTKPDGSRLRIDDPALTPIWAAAARLNLPVFIHTGDPQEFWQPLDYNNERWLELSLFPNRGYQSDEYPSFEQLVEERNNLFSRNPNTKFVTAHLGWHASELGVLAKLMDENPNLYGEVGAILYDIGRQPRAARDFFIKYQDRILFGKDSYQPVEYPYYWRVFETNDDYFDYYRDYHAFWKLYGIDLPDEVLKKVYYKNAIKLMPRAPQGDWPQ